MLIQMANLLSTLVSHLQIMATEPLLAAIRNINPPRDESIMLVTTIIEILDTHWAWIVSSPVFQTAIFVLTRISADLNVGGGINKHLSGRAVNFVVRAVREKVNQQFNIAT